MHRKMNVLNFLNICSKGNLGWTKNKFDQSLVFSWLHLSSLLVRCVVDVACKYSHNNFYKQNERFNMYMFNV